MEGLFDARRYLIPFRSSLLPHVFTDVLVIGAGVAGLRAALSAGERADVIILAKAGVMDSNTAEAQGGIACVIASGDSVRSHIDDTLAAGAGLCDEPVVARVIGGGSEAIRELLDWGMEVDRDAGGSLMLGREGGHEANRIIHSHGDATGRSLASCLMARVKSCEAVRIFESCFAIDLITPSDEPRAPVMGAITFHTRYGLQVIWAKATIVAAGGAGMLYRETSNPRVATGDGPAMAYRAGASLRDLAFMQFHPTTLYVPGAARWLITEAVRGEGATVLDDSGYRFMPDVHPQAELAPRDVVTQAIMRRISSQGGRHVWLDARSIPHFAARFPGIAALLARFNLDASRDLIPVHPAAHYAIGGVRTDDAGRSDVPGLFAVGEAACSGVHGANRLASNSLLEGLVLGRIVGHAAAEYAAGEMEGGWHVRPRPAPIPIVSDIRPSDQGELDLHDVQSSLRFAMWRNVGIIRNAARLTDAQHMFSFWAKYTLDKIFDDPEGWEIQNMLLVGRLMARSAAWREESRGCHIREDFPEAKDALRVHDDWRRGEAGPRASPVEMGRSA